MKLDRIDYNGGEIWINGEPVIGDLAYHKFQPYLFKITEANNSISKDCKKVVAQSITNPSYIDGVPFVEVGEDVKQLAKKSFLNSEYVVDNRKYEEGFIEGYKAAQAKQFTEQDMEAAVCFGMTLERFKDERLKSDDFKLFDSEQFKDFINSLKPKVSSIEIEVEEVCNDLSCSRMQLNGENSTCCGYSTREVPKTYQKDGKTFLKVKSDSYE